MRLIDADLFLENAIKELNCEGRCCECEHDNLCEVYKMVLKQPTAYDMDKVVEQMQEYIRESSNADYNRAMIEAIEIVKKRC